MFEIVPNFSEGRNTLLIDALVDTANATGAKVIDRTSDSVHNRSVLTIVGSDTQVLEAAVSLAGIAAERIDLRKHHGVHPRIGALDVLPFIPLGSESMEHAIELARDAAKQIWERYCIPSFFYGEAAIKPERKLLANVRKGQFEGLDVRFELPTGKPDVGNIAKHEAAGAIAIGARPILIAFNVNLATSDVTIAKSIASKIREGNGGLRTLRALGFKLNDNEMQVSLNVTSYKDTPLHRVFELIRDLAKQHKVQVSCSELIGCVPLEAVTAAAYYYLGIT